MYNVKGDLSFISIDAGDSDELYAALNFFFLAFFTDTGDSEENRESRRIVLMPFDYFQTLSA